MLIRIVMVVLGLAGASATVRAQASDDAGDWAVWLEAVTIHTPGQRDASVGRVSTWTREQIAAVLPLVSQLPPDERVRVLSRALALHADIALFSRTTTGYELPHRERPITLFADGREVGQMFGTFHWDVCRRLVEGLPRGDERTRLARVFYRATGAVLQLWAEHPELQLHLRAAARVMDEDAVLIMYEGTLYQVYADARSQRYFDQRREASGARGRANLMRPLPGTGLASTAEAGPTLEVSNRQAEGLFRRALAIDPLLHEARVRLAHILHNRGRHEDAARELARIAAAAGPPSSPFLDYYVAMLIGRVTRARGQLDAAEAAFERGLVAQPQAQAPRLALSELAMARGDAQAAARYLLPLTTGAAGDDPWWRVGRLHATPVGALLDEMWKTLQ
jgi:hypothetical protein